MQLESLFRFVALLSLTSALSLSAASGELDTGFTSSISPGLTPTSYPTFDNGTGAVNATALQSDGKILAGGNVSRYQTSGDLTALKRLLPTGALDTAFNSGGAGLAATDGQPEVNALLVAPDNTIYVGGTFSTYNDTPRSGILRLLADGSLDTGFAPTGLAGTFRYAKTLALQADGKLLVGGAFTTINGTFRRHLARLNTDGSLDTGFDPNVALGSATSIGDIAVQPDGKILVAGTRILGAFQNGQLLVRLHADGSLDTSFVPALFTTATGNVQQLLLLPDGRVVISGFLSLAPSGTDAHLACLHANGDLDTTFQANLGDGPDGWTGGDLVLQPDGTILVSGIFSSWNDQPRASVARLNPDGTLDPAFAPAPYDERHDGYATHFYSLAVQPDGKLLAGGWFSRVTDPALETYNLTRFTNAFSASSPGALRLLAATASVAENAGSITLQVSRFGGLTGAVSVQFTTSTGGSNGTATAGSDYTTTSGTLSWAAGEGGFKSITVPILQDLTAESAETFTVTLSSPTGGATLPASHAKTLITLRDDDSAPSVTRHPASVSLEQGANVTLSVAYDSVLPVSLRWQRDPDGNGPLGFSDVIDGGAIGGATTTQLAITAADPDLHAGRYRAVLTSTAGVTHSNAATVAIAVPAGSVINTTGPAVGRPVSAAALDASERVVVAVDGASFPSFAAARLVRYVRGSGNPAPVTTDAGFTSAEFTNVSGSTSTGAVYSLLVQPDGRILAGGFFTHVNGAARPVLARFSADGVFDAAYAPALPSATTNTYLQVLAPGAGGKFYAGFIGNGGLRRYAADGSLDGNFAPNTTANFFGSTNTNNAVTAVLEAPNGQLYVAHRFANSGFGSPITYPIWRLNADGTRDTAFVSPTPNAAVNSLARLPDGRLAVGGAFTTVSGQTLSRIAVVNTDGSLDTGFFRNPAFGTTVNRLLYHDGRLLAFGDYDNAAPTPRALARFNLDGTRDPSFSVGDGANGRISAAALTSTGDLFVAGGFTSVKGVARDRLAYLVANNHIGAVGFAPSRVIDTERAGFVALKLRRYGPATEAASIQWATADGLAADTSATAGVDYTAASGSVAWTAGDAADKTIVVELLNDSAIEPAERFRVVLSNPSGPVTAAASATIELIDDDTPVTFTAQPTGPASALFAGGSLNLTGAAVTSPTPVTYQWLLNGVAIPGATSANYTKAPASSDDAGLYTLVVTNSAGTFPSTTLHVVIAPQPGRAAPGQATTGRPSLTSGGVQTLLALPDGGALIGGHFSANPAANVPQNYLIRVKADGATDTSFTLSLSNNVRALLAQPDGKILIAGDFTFVGGVNQRYLYRLNADLTADTAFNSAVATAINTAWGTPRDLALDSTGRIYLGFNNNSNGSVWRFSSAGVLDADYTLSTSTVSFAGGGVTALAMQSDDKLLVGGAFTHINRFGQTAVAKNRLARVETDGAIDAGFTASLGTLPINDLLVSPTGRIFVAGGTGSGTNLVEVSATDGTTLTGGSSGNQLYEIAFGPDGRLALARASFSSGSGSISRLNIPAGATTSADSTFNVGTGPNDDVFSVAYAADGSLWIAGSFNIFNGFNSGGVLKLQGSPGDPGIVNPPARADVNAGGTARLAVGATGTNLSYQWFKNGAPLANDSRIGGATTAILTITGLVPSDDDTYTVVVSGGTPSSTVASAPVKINVLGAPVVASSPGSVAPALGSTITLAADVLAARPADYVWTRDGVVLRDGGRYSGATTGTLVITGANSSDNGVYTLTVTNDLDTAATAPATVTVAQTTSALFTGFPGLGASSPGSTSNNVNAILHLPDGRTLLGVSGSFRGVTNTNVSAHLVLVDAAGNLTATPAGAFNAEVRALHALSDGKILVSGAFTTVGGVARSRLARLNADLTVDTSFVPPSASNTIELVTVDSLGRIYLYGSGIFSYGDQNGYNGLVRLAADGTLDLGFKANVGGITSMVALPAGKLLLGGSLYNSTFNDVSVTSNGVLRLNANGTHDTSFAPSLPNFAGIMALAADASGRVLVSGYGDGAYFFRRLQSNGGADSSFSFTESLNAQIERILVQPDGKIVVGGTFITPTKRLFRLNNDGSRDTAGFNVGTGLSHTSDFSISVNALAPDALGRLWVGGSRFTSYNGATANALAVLQGQGSALAILRHPGGLLRDLGVSATFTVAATGNNALTYQWRRNGTPLSNSARISGVNTPVLTITDLRASDANSYTVTVSTPTSNLTSNPALLSVLAAPEITQHPVSATRDLGDSVTFSGGATGAATLAYRWHHGATALNDGPGVAGATTSTLTLTNLPFTRAGDYTLRVTNTHGQDTSTVATLTVERRPGAFASGLLQPTANSTVFAILHLDDGSTLVGGAFTSITVNGVSHNRSRLARFLANGTLDPSFTPAIPGTVRAIAQDSAGRVFIGGDFAGSVTVGGVTANRTRVARLTSALVLDTAFNTATAGPNAYINALGPTHDGGVYVGGAFGFNAVGATTVNRIARLTANGSLDTAFTAATSINNEVKSLLRRADGQLYAGGTFGTQLLSATGVRDTAFAPEGFIVQGQAMLLLPNGSLMLAANGGFPQNYLRRINANTGATLDDYSAGHFSQVTALALQSDNKLLSGSLGPIKRTNLANDTDDTGFSSFDSSILALAVDGDGRIWVGGNFNNYNGVATGSLAVLNGGSFKSANDPSGALESQTITFAAIADRPFSSATISLSATASSNLPVTFTVVDGPATVSGSTLTITGIGEVTVRASQAGNSTYAPASAERTFTVTRATQKITFGKIATQTLPTAPFTVKATADSGLPVTVTVVSGPATVSGKTVTLTGHGTVTLRATQAGDTTYTPAAAVDRIFVVNAKPTITTQPVKATVVLGKPVKFEVSATGSPTLTYQWLLNGNPIQGATKATYAIKSTTAAHAGTYTVTVKNAFGSVTSSKAALAFGTAPSITKQPVAVKVKELGSATFSVTATGLPKVKYQWRRNGQDIPGATKATYQISSVNRSQAGDYTVVVTNLLGSTTSTIAKLTVTAVSAPEAFDTGSLITYTGTVIDSRDGAYGETRSFTTGPNNTIEGGTFTYIRTGASKATITYEVATEESDYTETETATILLTFTSKTGGTYTSSGDYEGTHDVDGSYEGTFTGSGTFTYSP